MEPGETRVVRVDDRHRYELRRTADDRLLGVCDFRDHDGDGGAVTDLPHVEVDPSLRGHGLAALLVREALADVRARGRAARPICSYVRAYVAQHPHEA